VGRKARREYHCSIDVQLIIAIREIPRCRYWHEAKGWGCVSEALWVAGRNATRLRLGPLLLRRYGKPLTSIT